REIANAFLQNEAAVAQRISRAKKRLRERRARFELPPVDKIPARLGAVLEVVYLVFNEGYGPHSGDERRRSLCREASMLADQLTEIAPTISQVWGLAALLQFQSSRFDARLAPDGTPVPLDEQERRRWDRRHMRLGGTVPGRRPQRRRAWPPRRLLPPAGRDRRSARPRADVRRDRLGRHRAVVRRGLLRTASGVGWGRVWAHGAPRWVGAPPARTSTDSLTRGWALRRTAADGGRAGPARTASRGGRRGPTGRSRGGCPWSRAGGRRPWSTRAPRWCPPTCPGRRRAAATGGPAATPGGRRAGWPRSPWGC